MKGSKGKKYKIITPDNKAIQFGATGYTDFTLTKDEKKKDAYVARHRGSENWGKSGIDTAGFWAKHLLWNKPSLSASIRDTEQKFGIHIIRKKE
jgi:hypothetical protein